MKSLVGPRTIAAGNGSYQASARSGGRRRRPVVRIFLTVLMSAIGILGFAVPAHAATWYTQKNPGWCGTFFGNSCYVQWTSGWPGGIVRAVGDRGEYEVGLGASCGGSSFRIVAVSYPGRGGSVYTPAVTVGKYCAYQGFARFSSVGKWFHSSGGSVYLGD